MKQQLVKIMEKFHKYNSDNMAFQAFGIDGSIVYDALVIAPSFTPYKLGLDSKYDVSTLKEGAYIGGYLVRANGLNIAWVKTSSSESNLIDHLAICAELKFKKLIFIGAVGALKKEFEIGDICTPSYSIAGDNAHTYLKDSIDSYIPYEKVVPSDMKFIDEIILESKNKGIEIKKSSVFCTPSIACEYLHLDEIKRFDTDLIEMETAAFYLMGDLLEVPSIALLVVSDNSASGVALVGRNEDEQSKYNKGRF